MTQEEPIIESFVHPLGGDLYLRGKVRVIPGAGEIAGKPEPKPVVVLVHGFKSFQDWGFNPYLASELARARYYVVQFNFSCNGVRETDFDELEKFAVNTYSRELEDLSVLLTLLLEGSLPLASNADSNRIALLGHSRGGGDSILFASEHPEITSVITWNGIASANLFDEAFREKAMNEGVAYVPNARTGQLMPIRRVFFEDLERHADRYDIARKLAELKIPVLSVQGDEDSDRLKEGFRVLREAAPHQRFATIEGGTHTFGAVHPFVSATPQLEKALQATREFLAEHLAGGPTR